MDMTHIVLHVERLCLKGFRHTDRDALAESLRAELGRQFGESEAAKLLAVRSNRARVRIPEVRLPAAAKAAQVGTLVARGIARGLKS